MESNSVRGHHRRYHDDTQEPRERHFPTAMIDFFAVRVSVRLRPLFLSRVDASCSAIDRARVATPPSLSSSGSLDVGHRPLHAAPRLPSPKTQHVARAPSNKNNLTEPHWRTVYRTVICSKKKHHQSNTSGTRLVVCVCVFVCVCVCLCECVCVWVRSSDRRLGATSTDWTALAPGGESQTAAGPAAARAASLALRSSDRRRQGAAATASFSNAI